jgi:molybdate-binding protein
VGGVERLYPVAATPMGVVHHDGIYQDGTCRGRGRSDPRRTLVMACCDPAVGLLAAELARMADVRLIALQRPSRMCLTLLGQGLIHAAGVHLTSVDQPGGNARVVRSELGLGYSLLRVARWEEGIAFAPGRHLPSVRAAVRSDLCWIGREDGSGARQCLDELLGSRRAEPRCVASDHRGVAEAIRSGWADAGVCLRLVSEEAGLEFLGVRQEAYDLCIRAQWAGDLRIQALLEVVRSPSYRRALSELPGYDSVETGELQHVT